jgi:hypothetical protein
MLRVVSLKKIQTRRSCLVLPKRLFKEKQHPKADEWPLLGQIKEVQVRLQVIVVVDLCRKMVVVAKKTIRNRLWYLAVVHDY